jgi:hypothetical protein
LALSSPVHLLTRFGYSYLEILLVWERPDPGEQARFINPGVELSPVNRVEIFCDYMDDFNPGVETLYYTFSASIRGSKKSLYFVFL